MMQINAASGSTDYYQRAPRCCPGRMSQIATTTMTTGNSERSLRISTTIRGAELLCCCCSCSTMTSAKSPGLLASLGVCLLVFGYTLLGAFAFMALEGGFKPIVSFLKILFGVKTSLAGFLNEKCPQKASRPFQSGRWSVITLKHSLADLKSPKNDSKMTSHFVQ